MARPHLEGQKSETKEDKNSAEIGEPSASGHTVEPEEDVRPTIVPRTEQPPLGITEASSNNLNIHRISNDLGLPERPLAKMSLHRFWSTQPVPNYGEVETEIQEGPIMSINRTQVAMEPSSLLPGFEWVTMDLTKEEELRKVFELLSEHYVEDEDSEFRLDYSPSFLKW
jgi:glycylpeptide N-tetradecanoyltransferase